MPIKFKKMHGLGNDFVVFDTLRQKVAITPDLIKQMAHRFTGIGCDQVLIISRTTHPQADFEYTIYNADGSLAGQCGNGARCVARYVQTEQLSDKNKIIFSTQQHLTTAHIKNLNTISVEIAVPNFDPQAMPMTLPTAGGYHLTMAGQLCKFTTVSVGNPHVVMQVADVQQAQVKAIGQAFNEDAHFPEGVNVSFCQIISPQQIALRVYERGVGETLACGSAACASVVCLRQLDLLDAQVTVRLPGGQLTVHWPGKDQPVVLTGDANEVFDGVYYT